MNFWRIVEGLRLLYFPDLNQVDPAQFRSLEENSLGYEEDEGPGEKTFLRLLLIEEPEAHCIRNSNWHHGFLGKVPNSG